MAHGIAARRRRRARRAVARAQGVKNAKQQQEVFSLASTLEARAAARAARAEQFAGSGSGSLPLGPRTQKWDASAADKAVRSWAGADDAPNAKYGSAFMVKQGDGSKFGDYKLGFAQPLDGALTANWGGVTAVAGVLQGARGGADITPAETSHAKSLCEGYYSKAAKQYKDDSIKVPWKAAAEAAIQFALERGLDVFYADDGEPTNENGRYIGVGGDFNPMELIAAQTAAAVQSLAYAEVGPDADPVLLAVAVARWEEAFASMPACANCDDAYADHLGTAGPCTAEGCSCNGYEAPSESASGQIGEMFVRIRPNLDGFQTELGQRLQTIIAAELERFGMTDFKVSFDSAVADTLPDEHQPGERLPRRNPSPKPRQAPAPAAEQAGSLEWSAIFAPEGRLTSDGRAFAPGSITWRELPLTLMAMIETSEGGHIGAEVAGRIDKIWRDEAASLIRAQGVFADTDYGSLIACAALGVDPSELGLEENELTASLVTNQTLRGISVDLAIAKYETGPRSDWFDDEGNWAPKEQAAADESEPPSLLDLYSEDMIAVVLEAEIGMTTVCPFPAFAEAKIAIGDSLVAGANPAFWTVTQDAGWTATRRPLGSLAASLTASGGSDGSAAAGDCGCEGDALTAAAAGLVPVEPPAAWFDNPGLEEATALTVTDEGRVFGHAAAWGVCHIGLPGSCRTAPHSASGYEYFHLGEVVCEDGSRIACGQITLDTNHADRGMNAANATAHYDETGTVVAHVRVGEDEHGIWVAGALQPDACAEKVRLLRGAKLSGDWRRIDGEFELVALLTVNVPGFPVPRARALTASVDGSEPEVITLIAAGIPIFDADLDPADRERFAALRAQTLFQTLQAA